MRGNVGYKFVYNKGTNVVNTYHDHYFPIHLIGWKTSVGPHFA